MKKNLDGIEVNALADERLAPYAQKNADSLGRKFPETSDPLRTPFQRDRDRIIHSSAFRRLKGKMQVVSPKTGDHFRNRLTHTIEVAQIARDLARQLKLNEDLAEAIALAHDLGHPPFGHAGESALHQKMKEHGLAFEHNAQSLRIVDFFEPRYIDFPGLNLTQEVREGMQKHNTFFDRPLGTDTTRIYSPHLESQLVDISDAIAYLSADLEDGLRGGFFTISDLQEIDVVQEVLDIIPQKERDFRPSVVRGIMRLFIRNLADQSAKNVEKFSLKSLADVQKNPEKIIAFSQEFFQKFKALKTFLMERYYRSESVQKMTKSGEQIIGDIFEFLLKHPEKISFRRGMELHDWKRDPVEVRICDFVAGMTDEFAENFWKEYCS